MKTYTSILSEKNTPQTEPLALRTDMVKNSAGGYVFEATNSAKLQRFLLLGTMGGTYYASEKSQTEAATKFLIKQLQDNGIHTLQIVDDYVTRNRILKMDTALYILALACTYGDATTKTVAYNLIKFWCKTGTHLFQFVSMVNDLRGWSGGLRRGVSAWYDGLTIDKLVYQTLKYQNRAGFTHKDVLRLAHPKAKDATVNEYYKFLVDKPSEFSHIMFDSWKKAKSATTTAEVIDSIKTGRLTWEMIPTEFLNDLYVLGVLVDNMPLMALIRNLNRFTYTGALDQSETFAKVYSKLTSEAEVRNSKVHPIFVLSAMKTYGSGKGEKGGKTWTVNQRIMDALQKTFDFAFKSLDNELVTGVKTLVAVDVSGSMSAPVSGMNMSCTEAASALALTNLKQVVDSHLILFDTSVYESGLGARHSYDEAFRAMNRGGGGTDCSLPFSYALTKRIKYDSIVIYTDSETWAGRSHGKTLLDQYRKQFNPNVKVVEVALVANDYSGFPQDDSNVLRTVGFDSALPQVIKSFIA